MNDFRWFYRLSRIGQLSNIPICQINWWTSGWSTAKALICINHQSPRPTFISLRNIGPHIKGLRLQHSGQSGILFQEAKAERTELGKGELLTWVLQTRKLKWNPYGDTLSQAQSQHWSKQYRVAPLPEGLIWAVLLVLLVISPIPNFVKVLQTDNCPTLPCSWVRMLWLSEELKAKKPSWTMREESQEPSWTTGRKAC